MHGLFLINSAKKINGECFRLGAALTVDHAHGLVVGETAMVGDSVSLYHGVTLGGIGTEAVKRHPTLGDGVVVHAGVHLLGPLEIPPGTEIPGNAYLVNKGGSS